MLSLASKRVIGLVAIVAGVLIIVLGVTAPNPFADTRSYWVELDSAQGLGATGRDVRLAGVNVGTIEEVRREGDDAVVELVLEGDEFPVKTDARVAMRPHTLFEGSSFVDLEPGSPSAPELDEGGTIPKEQTSNYVTLDEALRVLRPSIRESIADLTESGSKTLRPRAVAGIQKTLRGAPPLTRYAATTARALQGPSRRELAGAIAGASKTVDAVANRERELIPLAQRLNRTAAALTVDGGVPLDGALAALPGALQELEAGAPALTGLVDRLDRFAVAASPALPDFARAVERTTPLLARSIPVLEDVTPLIASLRRISSRLADASPTLADLMLTLNPVTKTFGESVLPTLSAPSRRGPPTYEQLLATFTAANAVFRPYQTQSQNPNGYGHLWNLGTYGELLGPFGGLGTVTGGLPGGGLPGLPGLPGSPAPFSCEKVDQISVGAAEQFAAAGACG